MAQLFFELIQIAIGNKSGFSKAPTDKEWAQLFNFACKQSLVSITLEGVNKLKNATPNTNLNININLLLEWIGLQQQTIAQNQLQNKRTKELCEILKDAG